MNMLGQYKEASLEEICHDERLKFIVVVDSSTIEEGHTEFWMDDEKGRMPYAYASWASPSNLMAHVKKELGKKKVPIKKRAGEKADGGTLLRVLREVLHPH